MRPANAPGSRRQGTNSFYAVEADGIGCVSDGARCGSAICWNQSKAAVEPRRGWIQIQPLLDVVTTAERAFPGQSHHGSLRGGHKRGGPQIVVKILRAGAGQ